MHSSALTAIVILPIVAAWAAVCVYHYLAMRRQRRHHAEWTRLAPGLAELDADLDRTWTAERDRIRR